MTRAPRVSHTDEFRALWLASGLTKAEVAELTSSALDTVIAWTKKATSKSAVPAPKWAVELLAAKLDLEKKTGKIKSLRSELRAIKRK